MPMGQFMKVLKRHASWPRCDDESGWLSLWGIVADGVKEGAAITYPDGAIYKGGIVRGRAGARRVGNVGGVDF